MPLRGPKRARSSKIKLKCAWKGCRRGTDVKNKPYSLQIHLLNRKQTRKLHGNCGTARFCCPEHLAKCKLQERAAPGNGGREALTPDQVRVLFETFVFHVQAPWAAVALVLGIFLGERQACILSARDTWFTGLQTQNPCVRIPKVNGKTRPREIPLDKSFATLLLNWTSPENGPLRGTAGSQWPHPKQKLQMGQEVATRRKGKGNLLFPGRVLGGRDARNYDKAMTSRGFHDKFMAAQAHIAQQRDTAQSEGRTHVFDEVSLARVTSHSMKKTSVTLMKEAGVATTVVSLLTGTSCRVLDSTYFQPSRKLQRKAAADAFSRITEGIGEEPATPESGTAPFCTKCGRLAQQEWFFCPSCGTELLRS